MTAPDLGARPRPSALSHLILCVALILGSFGLCAAPARADTPAASYVGDLTNKAIKILTDQSLDEKGRYNAFHELILNNIDLDRISAFTLGRYANAMRTSGRYDEYKQLFGDYISRVYAARMSGYSGEQVKIVKTMPHQSDEMVVYSLVEPGAAGGDPVAVNWRLTQKDSSFKILDVQIVGAWMSIEQQSQFSSIISNNNRDVTKLIDYLREQNAAPLPKS